VSDMAIKTETRVENDAVTVWAEDGRGGLVQIAASGKAQPWLVRTAMREMMPHLMPGAREAQ